MRAHTMLAAVSIAALAPALAGAETIDVDSTTLLNLASQTRGGVPGQRFDLANTATAFEILSLSARDVKTGVADDVGFVLKAWGAYDIADRRWDAGTPSSFNADLVTAYAQGRLLDRHLTLRLGRIETAAGTARMIQIDGGQAVVLLPAGFQVSGYAGSPVAQRFATRSGPLSWNPVGGDLATGGRLGWSLALPGAPGRGIDLGASVNYVTDAGNPVREEVGADARVKLWEPLVVSASGAYSVYDSRLAEIVAQAGWTIAKPVLVEADYRFVAPDLLLARNSILSVFSASDRQIFGGGVTWFVSRALKVAGYYHVQLEPGATEDAAKYVGSDATARVEWQRGPSTLGAEAYYLDAFENGYTGGRIFGRRDCGRAFATADVLAYFFRDKVNGQSSAVTGSLSLGYELLRGLSAVASGQAGVTPYMEQTYEFMAKLVYGATYRKSEVR